MNLNAHYDLVVPKTFPIDIDIKEEQSSTCGFSDLTTPSFCLGAFATTEQCEGLLTDNSKPCDIDMIKLCSESDGDQDDTEPISDSVSDGFI